MKKSTLLLVLTTIAAAVLSACSMSAPPEPTMAPVERPAQSVNVLDEYALLADHTQYISADNAYSIQFPNGTEINDSDINNVVATIKGEFESADIINITREETAPMIDSEAKLMELLKDDNSIDITGFFILKNNGEYTGYKYTYTAVSDPQLKGIKSTYFSADGSAFVVTATINNGGDEINMTNINTIVDTFINYNK